MNKQGSTDSKLQPAELVVMILSLAAYLPFLGQAFHLDDYVFLSIAQHVTPNPLALYNFTMNWYGKAEHVFALNVSPPLVPYYLALLTRIAHGSEWIYHLAFAPFLLLALEGARRLARRFTPTKQRALWVLIWIAVAPALAICSHTIMADVPTLSLFLFGLSLAIEGLDQEKSARAFLGGLIAGLSALCKYNGLIALPVILVYTILRRYRFKQALVVLSGVMVPITLWSIASLMVYGHLHWLASANREGQNNGLVFSSVKILYQLSTSGLAIALGPLIALAASGIITVDLVLALSIAIVIAIVSAYVLALPVSAFLLLVFGLTGGIIVLILSLKPLLSLARRHFSLPEGNDADRLFLSLWFLGTLVFNSHLNGATIRYLLPALVPIILLIEPMIPIYGLSVGYLLRNAVAAIVALVVSLTVSESDQQLANGYRRFVTSLPVIAQQRWFDGHWGLQYYLEQRGARILNSKDCPRPGDEIIIPLYAPPHLSLSERPKNWQIISQTTIFGWTCFRTVSYDGQYDFHCVLPFGICNAPLEKLTRLKVLPIPANQFKTSQLTSNTRQK